MTKILGPTTGYTDLLDAATEAKLKERATVTSPKIPLRPSASGYCAKRLTYDLVEQKGLASYEKDGYGPQVARLLNLGHAVEWSSFGNFKDLAELEIKYKQQVVSLFKLDTGELIEGSIDGVFLLDGHNSVMDVKSAKDGFSAFFRTRWDETLAKYKKMHTLVPIGDGGTAFYADDLPDFLEELGDDFSADNYYQLNLYACSEFIRERGIDHAFIYRYNKNDSRHLEVRFRPSMEVFHEVRAKFNAIASAVQLHGPDAPSHIDRDFALGTMRCAFCPRKKSCYPETDALKEWWKTFPNKKWPKDTNRLGALGTALEDMFAKRATFSGAASELKAKEDAIVKLMREKELSKIKLDNGEVYELKYLKSPRPHHALRRSKL